MVMSMPDTAAPQRQRTRPTREQTRTRVLDAAGKIFDELGYDATSLDRIAASAGLTKGAIYSGFGSKEALFGALMSQRIDGRVAHAVELARQAATRQQLAAAIAQAIASATLAAPGWHVAFFEFWTRAMRNTQMREVMVASRQKARNTIADTFRERAAELDVELPMRAEDIAVTILALSNGFAVEQLLGPDIDSGTLLPTILDRVFRAA